MAPPHLTGFFYGMSADAWQAFALAVYIADRDRNA